MPISIKNNRKKVTVSDGYGNITIKVFDDLRKANTYEEKMWKKITKGPIQDTHSYNCSEVKILRGHHE
tara:strand:+ start:260 stop:463 length:204 start_codon:yes stop_codon:yes gene_type:complete